MPGHGHSVRVDARLQLVHEHRPEITALDVFLARPDGLDRDVLALRHFHRIGDEVRSDVGAPAEPAAEERRVHEDLLGLQSRDGRTDALVHGLILGPGPDVAAIRLHVRHRVQRLHRRMRQVGNLVDRFDGLGRGRQRLLGVAFVLRDEAGLSRHLSILLAHRIRVESSVRAVIPDDLERLPSGAGAPEILGDDRNARGDGLHLDDAGNGFGLRGVDTLDRPAADRRMRHDRGEHARKPHVDAEFGLSRDLVASLEALHVRADDLEVLDVFERDLRRDRKRRCLRGQLSIRRAPFARVVMDAALFGAQGRSRHSPGLRGGLDAGRRGRSLPPAAADPTSS